MKTLPQVQRMVRAAAVAVLVIGAAAVAAMGAGAKSNGGQPMNDPAPKIKAAVVAKLTSYFRSKDFTPGSSDVRVAGVTVAVERIEPTPGWEGRFAAAGTVTLKLTGRSGGTTQVRSFDATSTVGSDGKVEVVDFNTR